MDKLYKLTPEEMGAVGTTGMNGAKLSASRLNRVHFGDNGGKGQPYIQFDMPESDQRLSVLWYPDSHRMVLYDQNTSSEIESWRSAKYETFDLSAIGLEDWFTVNATQCNKANRVVQMYVSLTAKKAIPAGTTVGTLPANARPCASVAMTNYGGTSTTVRLGQSGGIVVGSAVAAGDNLYRSASFLSSTW